MNSLTIKIDDGHLRKVEYPFDGGDTFDDYLSALERALWELLEISPYSTAWKRELSENWETTFEHYLHVFPKVSLLAAEDIYQVEFPEEEN